MPRTWVTAGRRRLSGGGLMIQGPSQSPGGQVQGGAHESPVLSRRAYASDSDLGDESARGESGQSPASLCRVTKQRPSGSAACGFPLQMEEEMAGKRARPFCRREKIQTSTEPSGVEGGVELEHNTGECGWMLFPPFCDARFGFRGAFLVFCFDVSPREGSQRIFSRC
jgi:hypothetical protein